MNLRTLFTTLAISAVGISLYADIIIKHDGTTINAYEVEIGSKSVMYNESQGADAVSRRIPITDVYAVKIGDGPITPVGQIQTSQPQNAQQATSQAQGEVKPVPAGDNAQLIAAYNKEVPYHPTKKFGGVTEDVLVYYSVGDESILSTDDLEVSIVHCTKEEELKIPYGNEYEQAVTSYRIAIKNKTAHPIYVDLANTFRTTISGESKPWFDGSTFTETTGNGSGASIGLGAVAGALGVGGAVGTLANGISVGGGSSSTTSVSKGTQRIMPIAPNSIGYLPLHLHIVDKKVEELPEQYINSGPAGSKEQWNIRKWELRTYNRETSPLSQAYHITIFPTADMTAYYTLPINLYARATYGTPYVEYPEYRLYKNRKSDTPWCIYDYDHMIIGKYYLRK